MIYEPDLHSKPSDQASRQPRHQESEGSKNVQMASLHEVEDSVTEVDGNADTGLPRNHGVEYWEDPSAAQGPAQDASYAPAHQ